jgi:hypothetical protein
VAFGLAGGALAAEPEIWLAPVDPIKRAVQEGTGPSDFMDLFPAEAPWKTAASRVQVFEIYPQFLAKASDDMLRTVIDGLKTRHIALAVSYGLVHRPKGEPMHEGYGAEIATRDIARLQRLGADVRYVVADEPLLFGHFYWGEGATPRSIEETAKDVASTARQFREAFPNVRIGMDDPVLLYKPGEWEPAMREFLEVYQKEFGEPMAFVRVECASFPVREWLPRYISAEKFLRSVGVPFGELITGDASDTSDAEWVRKAEERYVTWESDGRPAPAQVVFQSWMPRPSRILPETAPDTLTYLLNSYFGNRTSLTVTRDSGVLHGRLVDASGAPVVGAHVLVTTIAGFDAPSMIRRKIQCPVPANAQYVEIGLRIGMEGSLAGKAQLTMGPTSYEEKGGESARVFDFADSLKGWGKSGTAAISPNHDAANGTPVVKIDVESGQTLLLNSKLLPATPGGESMFTFDVHVRPGTETGYLVMFFFDASKKVVHRVQESLVSEVPDPARELVTDANGNIELPLTAPDLQGAREYRFNFLGDSSRRAALATVPAAP